MKIGFAGTGGTGKSTLLNELSNQGILERMGLPVLPSIMSSVLEELDFKNDTDLNILNYPDSVKFQTTAWEKRIKAEIESEHNFISDRTLVDHLAYIITLCGIDNLPNPSIPCTAADIVSVTDKYFHITHQIMSTYDFVFIFPMKYFHQVDHRRSDALYHHALDGLIFSLIKAWHVPYFILKPHKLEHRVGQFVNRMKEVRNVGVEV